MFKKAFTINQRKFGEGAPVVIVAEMSANHNQKYDMAVATIKAFKKAGADAIKLQTYTPDTMTLNLNKGSFEIPHSNQFAGPKNLFELYKVAYTPWDWQPKLKAIADHLGILLWSTPFDPTAVDFLEKNVNPPAYKVASFELCDHNLLKRVAKTGKPVILSNGGASVSDIAESVEVLSKNGCSELVLLQCSSGYPSLPEQMHLQKMRLMKEVFDVPTGVSDHSEGIGVAVAAVALGACMVEKHITIDKKSEGPDHRFSMEPDEFALMVRSIRQAEKAVKGISFKPDFGREQENKLRFSRSLYIIKDIKSGEKLTIRNLRSIRPGDGLPPKYFEQLLGIRVTKDVLRGTPASWDLVK